MYVHLIIRHLYTYICINYTVYVYIYLLPDNTYVVEISKEFVTFQRISKSMSSNSWAISHNGTFQIYVCRYTESNK